ncbi:hypothetical protein CC1G_09506 [Coprinopsis cinerea okayama7|uniref:Uncharacterized protein n=1 Tax=Coprinopsis cinerea (strain Okayama-7 / 130 / ATCC MYA-4618 / FGSC 9003) TaxID=240176 RepID=A8P0S6_COPC7|nr:hypothetical protein CC1G_09506 [Coprinopsis cinerea okayama7\|eukprot:XP_001837955.2 hypothetical protein CC1G_09506 [Coprinopsis cinerea okayama7\
MYSGPPIQTLYVFNECEAVRRVLALSSPTKIASQFFSYLGFELCESRKSTVAHTLHLLMRPHKNERYFSHDGFPVFPTSTMAYEKSSSLLYTRTASVAPCDASPWPVVVSALWLINSSSVDHCVRLTLAKWVKRVKILVGLPCQRWLDRDHGVLASFSDLQPAHLHLTPYSRIYTLYSNRCPPAPDLFLAISFPKLQDLTLANVVEELRCLLPRTSTNRAVSFDILASNVIGPEWAGDWD